MPRTWKHQALPQETGRVDGASEKEQVLCCRSAPSRRLQVGKALYFHLVRQFSVSSGEKGVQSPNPLSLACLCSGRIRFQRKQPRALLVSWSAGGGGADSLAWVPSCRCELPISGVPLIQIHARARAFVLRPQVPPFPLPPILQVTPAQSLQVTCSGSSGCKYHET